MQIAVGVDPDRACGDRPRRRRAGTAAQAHLEGPRAATVGREPNLRGVEDGAVAEPQVRRLEPQDAGGIEDQVLGAEGDGVGGGYGVGPMDDPSSLSMGSSSSCCCREEESERERESRCRGSAMAGGPSGIQLPPGNSMKTKEKPS